MTGTENTIAIRVQRARSVRDNVKLSRALDDAKRRQRASAAAACCAAFDFKKGQHFLLSSQQPNELI